MTSVDGPPEQSELGRLDRDLRRLIDSNSCTVHELFIDYRHNPHPPEWCKSTLREFLNPQQQRVRDLDHVLTVYFLRQPINSSWEPSLVDRVLGAASDYQAVCRSSAGTATWFGEMKRFCFQTPKDDADLSCSFGATFDENKKSGKPMAQCLLVSPKSPEELLCSPEGPLYSQDCWPTEQWYAASTTAFVLITLQVLQLHVSYTSSTLTELMRQVSTAEDQILDPAKLENFSILIRDLHSYNADLIKLERRWHFEQKLSSSIGKMIKALGSNLTTHVGESFSGLEKLSQASEYDLGVLPRRIQNQFTAVRPFEPLGKGTKPSGINGADWTLKVYNLMAQRDTKATISLATASQRDSSSMKTIAVMTLIFLPPTFICSFFSMSFFNFEATGAKSIWIYFATAAPLTAVVTLSWLVYTSWRRKADERRFERKASSAHAV